MSNPWLEQQKNVTEKPSVFNETANEQSIIFFKKAVEDPKQIDSLYALLTRDKNDEKIKLRLNYARVLIKKYNEHYNKIMWITNEWIKNITEEIAANNTNYRPDWYVAKAKKIVKNFKVA